MSIKRKERAIEENASVKGVRCAEEKEASISFEEFNTGYFMILRYKIILLTFLLSQLLFLYLSSKNLGFDS